VGYAGGYIAGGGHTPLSGLYGMAADHVMALEIVTADGRFITASSDQNTDLFWALRGGGGSTFGVVTSIIIRVHPALPVVTSEFTYSTSATVTADVFWEGFRTFLGLFIPFTDAGTYSWWSITPGTTPGSYSFRMMPFFAPNHTIASFEALVKPWFDRLQELGITFTTKTITQHGAYYPAYNATWGSNALLNGAGRISKPTPFHHPLSPLTQNSLPDPPSGPLELAPPPTQLALSHQVQRNFKCYAHLRHHQPHTPRLPPSPPPARRPLILQQRHQPCLPRDAQHANIIRTPSLFPNQ